MKQIGIHAVISLMTYLVTITFSFRAIKCLRVESFFKKDHVFEIQIFLLFFAIAIGFLVGQFIITLVDQSMALQTLL